MVLQEPTIKVSQNAAYKQKNKIRKLQILHRNMVKVTVLNGESTIQDLVTISFYDSKPVYFLSTVIPEVKWRKVNEKFYSKNLNRKVTLPFLRQNFVDENNQDMNSVDRADQLRTNYSVGKSLRQRKW